MNEYDDEEQDEEHEEDANEEDPTFIYRQKALATLILIEHV